MSNRWEDIRNRLHAVHISLEKGFEASCEKKTEILRLRAEELAKPDKGVILVGSSLSVGSNLSVGSSLRLEPTLEVLEFMLAHEKYALELPYIREVYPLKELTPVPCTPDFVLGIINFRGQILSIIDLKKFFSLPVRDINEQNSVIVIYSDDMEFGILADAVIGTRSVQISDIQSSLPTLTGTVSEYLKGVTRDRVIILNGEKILSDKNLIVYNEN